MITVKRIFRKQKKTLLNVVGWTVGLGCVGVFIAICSLHPGLIVATLCGFLLLMILFAG